jgi:DNA gyrase/topoisomerase IV subunit B
MSLRCHPPSPASETRRRPAADLLQIPVGDKVEPRREFVEKHALEARNLDV